MSPESKKRFEILRKRKTFAVSFGFLSLMIFVALWSELITNSKPLVAYVNHRVVVPSYFDYNREDMGLEGAGVVDYRELRPQMKWSLWPPLDWDPYETDAVLELSMSPPSMSHLMGTDEAGRDVFARLLYGTRVSFVFAVSTWLVSYVIGVALGLVQGYFGGVVDLIGQRLVEIFSSIPTFYLLILLLTLIQPNVYWLIVFTSLFGWVSISQFMRAEALRNRNLAYTEAARAVGATPLKVLFRHVLPNSLTPIITFSPFAIVGGISALAALDYLGFGVPAPTPSWGQLLDQAQRNFQVAWWLAFFPSFFLFISVVSLNLIGEAFRSAFDPRSR